MAETFTWQLLLGRTGRAKGMDDSGERGREREGRRGARQEQALSREGKVTLHVSGAGLEKAGPNADASPRRFCGGRPRQPM